MFRSHGRARSGERLRRVALNGMCLDPLVAHPKAGHKPLREGPWQRFQCVSFRIALQKSGPVQ